MPKKINDSTHNKKALATTILHHRGLAVQQKRQTNGCIYFYVAEPASAVQELEIKKGAVIRHYLKANGKLRNKKANKKL